MDYRSNRSIITQFAFTGFLLGLIFPIAAMVIELLSKDMSFTFRNLALAHGENLLLWIINIFPFFISAIGYHLGTRFAAKTRELETAAEEERKKTGKILSFTEKLSFGDIDAQYEFDTKNQEGDEIGQSLISLRDYLKKSKEEEKIRKKEDHQRSWVNEGFARFGDIVRQNSDNLQDLSYSIISNLTDYLDAKQGGVFLLNDDNPEDKHFELAACYAYNRKKFLEKRIEWKEGLIGACALEQETIYLTDIPEQHVTITSGLGETKPTALLIIPLKVNEEIYGVIELASLNKFEKYQIEFVEKLAETIASVVSGIKVTLHTARLLEESQEKEKKLRTQEDEMRKNLEELNIAKEEAARQGEMLANFSNAVNNTLVRAEYDKSGKLLYANNRFLVKLGYSSIKEVESNHISDFINKKDTGLFSKIWDEVSKGGKHFEGDIKHVTKQGDEIWLISAFTCVRKPDESIEKILFLGFDITDQKLKNLDCHAQMDAITISNLKANLNTKGFFIDANQKLLNTLELKLKDLKDKTILSLLEENRRNDLKNAWKNVLKGKPYECLLQFINPSGEKKWLQGTLTAVKNMYGEVAKIIYLAIDITGKIPAKFENQDQGKIFKKKVKS